MSSFATRKYLNKFLASYEKSSLDTRLSDSKRREHSLNTDLNKLHEVIIRAQKLYEDKGLTEEAALNLEKLISAEFQKDKYKNRTDLTFDEILEIKRRVGEGTKVTTAKGKEGFVYYIPGTKIEIDKVLQAGHDESILTRRTKAKLALLIRYRNRTKLGKTDIKLLDAFINIFDHNLKLQEYVDSVEYIPDDIGNNTERFKVADVINHWKKGGMDLSINIVQEPTATIKKSLKPDGVTFEVAFDNGRKGIIASGIKSASIVAGRILLAKAEKNSGSATPLSKLIYDTNWPELSGSPSFIEHIENTIIEKITKVKQPKFVVGTTTEKGKKSTTKVKLAAIPKVPKVDKPKSIRLRSTSGAFQSTANLQTLIQARLFDTIKKNMAPPALTYKSGRFAKSVELKNLHYDNRENAITAFLTYMRYPYATFEPGSRQGNLDRSPTSLITRSVREIATSLTTARLKTIVA